MYQSPVPEYKVVIPSFAELCETASRARNASDNLTPIQKLTYDQSVLKVQQEQDEWLRSVIHLQSDIVRYLSLPLDVQHCMGQGQASLPRNVTLSDLSNPAKPSKIVDKNSHDKRPLENGLLSDSDSDDTCKDPIGKQNKRHNQEWKTPDKPAVNGWSDKDSPDVKTNCTSEGKSSTAASIYVSSQKAVILDHGCYSLPDLSLLEEDLVKFLAQQRLQQLLLGDRRQPVGELVSLPGPVMSTAGNEDVSLSRQPPSDVLERCHAVLCPLGCQGRLYPMRKRVITLGSSSNCDVSLSHLKSCSRLSGTHACLIYNKSVAQFELINYSEYGTIVDGILYVSTHSDSHRKRSHSPSPLTIDHVKALGHGPRASRAQRRVDVARCKWKESDHSKTFVNAITKMSDKEDESSCGINNTVSTSKSVSSVAQTHSGSGRLRRDSCTSNSEKSRYVDSGQLKHNLRPRVKSEGIVQPQLDLRKSRETVGAEQSDRTGCGCAGLQPLNVNGGWSGSASLSHGSLIRIGCVQLLLSVAGQPGHTELIQSVMAL
jgi:hypothetical protein